MFDVELFENREHAGALLAQALSAYAQRPDVTVIGLPRGGVPVAAVLAEQLALPLDILIVRKLGVPGHQEFAMGAVASGGLCVLQTSTVAMLHISQKAVQQTVRRELDEIARRELLYGGHRPDRRWQGRLLIVVDDGLATGASMEAALQALRQAQPAGLVVAMPVGAPDTCERLRAEVDQLVCLYEPAGFHAVGQWYRDFHQVGDDAVRALLDAARRRQQRDAENGEAPGGGPSDGDPSGGGPSGGDLTGGDASAGAPAGGVRSGAVAAGGDPSGGDPPGGDPSGGAPPSAVAVGVDPSGTIASGAVATGAVPSDAARPTASATGSR